MSIRLQHATGDFIGPGQQQYKVLETLGSGGMGTVYKVENVLTGNIYAVKECDLLDDPNGREMTRTAALNVFLAEGREVERLQHPGIPRGFLLADENVRLNVCCGCGTVLDRGDSVCPNSGFGDVELHKPQAVDRRLYLFMAFVDGKDAAEAVENKRKPLEGEDLRHLLEHLEQIAETLEFLHARALIHRDVKPENIRMTAQRAYLLDFGLVAEEPPSKKTRRLDMATAFHGTEGYAAPEQVMGRPRCASDSFGFAMTLLNLVTGDDPSKPEVAQRFREEAPSLLAPGLDDSLAECIRRALSQRPESRPSMSEWRAVLRGKSTGPVAMIERAQTRHLRMPGAKVHQAAPPPPLRPGPRPGKSGSGPARQMAWPRLGRHWIKVLGGIGLVVLSIAVFFPGKPSEAFQVEALPGATIYQRMDDLREGRVLSGGETVKVRHDDEGQAGNWLRVISVNGKRTNGYLLRSKVVRSRS